MTKTRRQDNCLIAKLRDVLDLFKSPSSSILELAKKVDWEEDKIYRAKLESSNGQESCILVSSRESLALFKEGRLVYQLKCGDPRVKEIYDLITPIQEINSPRVYS